MASQIKFVFKPDGSATMDVATILHDLFEDYQFFEHQAAKIDRSREPLLYKRMVRASVMAFFNHFDGVLNRWLALIDPNFNLYKKSAYQKIERIRQEIGKPGRESDLLPPGHSRGRGLRNKLAHLELGNNDAEITEELLSGRFFRDAIELQNWLRIAAHKLGFDRHDDPKRIMKPYINALGEPSHKLIAPLSDEDEELVQMAAMTFMELDAREAADGHP